MDKTDAIVAILDAALSPLTWVLTRIPILREWNCAAIMEMGGEDALSPSDRRFMERRARAARN